MKKLGFGLMRLPLVDKADPAAVDVEQVKEMLDVLRIPQRECDQGGPGGPLPQRSVYPGYKASFRVF